MKLKRRFTTVFMISSQPILSSQSLPETVRFSASLALFRKTSKTELFARSCTDYKQTLSALLRDSLLVFPLFYDLEVFGLCHINARAQPRLSNYYYRIYIAHKFKRARVFGLWYLFTNLLQKFTLLPNLVHHFFFGGGGPDIRPFQWLRPCIK